jgi:hypothetical protein
MNSGKTAIPYRRVMRGLDPRIQERKGLHYESSFCALLREELMTMPPSHRDTRVKPAYDVENIGASAIV